MRHGISYRRGSRGVREKEIVVAYTGVIGPWSLFLFLALAGAVLWAADRWMAALGFWYDEREKGDRLSLVRVLLAVLFGGCARRLVRPRLRGPNVRLVR